METRTIVAILGLLAAVGAMADAYKWTDDEGVVHYSDRPHPGAERIHISEPNKSRNLSRNTSASTASPGDAANGVAPMRYESFEVTSPGAEETLWNIEATLSVSLTLNPPLQPGHQIRVYFDGNPRMVNATSFTLSEVYRGVHNLQAEVLDETGTMMIRTRPNRFYVQQSTVN